MITHEKFGLFFSFALSLLIGEAFGAHGLIALLGGLGSTIITTIIYKSHMLHLVDKYRARKDEINAKITEVKGQIKTVVRNIWGMIVFFYKVFTAPFRAYNWCKVRYQMVASKASQLRS